ncbi:MULTISPECIES: NAD(P)-binding protein [unclassified Phenylobacterium]|uniref:NAD(P)-binding protein n=1 Tax=unclassified Phenylobacterium TaxID=2640670 RepID=UPI00083A3297|nr:MULTISPECIES: NAD(P)-binding protein [unclassified Phenylobacterium]
MSHATQPQKVAILGGGMGGLTTALQLTSQPNWQERFDITVYQLGWRLGGKCASSRGPNARIEEHGIHGFMGSYFNALPMMSDVYAELNRPAGAPLATFEEAFLGSGFTMLWEWEKDRLTPWPTRAPSNSTPPTDGTSYKGLQTAIVAILNEIGQMLATAQGTPKLVSEGISLILDKAKQQVETVPLSEGPNHPLVGEIQAARKFIAGVVKTVDVLAPHIANHADDLRRALLTLDFYATLIVGALSDNVEVEGYDRLDEENWSDWLSRHGCHPATLQSPVVMTTVNICYQSPNGDTSRAARMGAGCYLNWTLRACAYMGDLIWSFAAGTGETVVAPIYEVLKRRGVKFEFFHKVEALRLDPVNRRKVAAIEMTVQATLKDPEAGYQPLIDVKGLPSWPHRPLYEQLNEGEYLRATGIDLESYWNGWPNEAFPRLKTPRTLRHGVDYDEIVFAISLGAVRYLCKELMDEDEAWRDMVDALPALQTQAMQIWLSKDMYELGWAEPLNPAKNELALSGTYFCPPNGNANFPDLLKWESWPEENAPKALWYFCGLMPDYEPPPPFSDTDYPRRQSERVKTQCIQYLQASIGTMLPKATVRANYGVGDPMGLDFNLLVDSRETGPGALRAEGVQRFDSQFWRANIDPTERYVTSPPGSTACRLEAWGSGFDNLTLAGDWIYTGLNVGSFEGATMSGKLASYALSGAPALDTIIGYPTMPRPHAPTRARTPAVEAAPRLRKVVG